MNENKTSQVQGEEFSWLVKDAKYLWTNGRKPSALLLLLCAVDALSGRAYPTLKSRERFEKYMLYSFGERSVVGGLHIHVKGHGEPLKLESVLYKYLRCPMVHEGTYLDVNEATGERVNVNWKDGERAISVDKGHVTIGANLILELLVGAINAKLPVSENEGTS